jgi:hypothetical protein
MFDNQFNLMVHDLRSEIIFEYGNFKSRGILHVEFDECGSYLKICRSRLVPFLNFNINGSRLCKGIILL